MKILKYQLMTEVNHGTEEEPNIVQTFNACEIRCTEETFESNYALALKEAVGGEVTVEDVPEPPVTAEEVRAQRDKLLAETDWTQVLDAPISPESREAFRVYRQALRDITEQEGFPEAVIWPEMPEAVKAEPDPVDTAVDALLGGDEA